MHTVTLSSKFQMVIPKAIREALHYKAGEKFLLIPKGSILQMVPLLSLNEIAGTCRGARTDNTRDRRDRV